MQLCYCAYPVQEQHQTSQVEKIDPNTHGCRPDCLVEINDLTIMAVVPRPPAALYLQSISINHHHHQLRRELQKLQEEPSLFFVGVQTSCCLKFPPPQQYYVLLS